MDTISGNELEFIATLGHIGKFNPAEESISVYLEQVELFFATNGIKYKKQVAVLLSVIGPHCSMTCWHLKSHMTNQCWLV